jgi:hypothetical protein
MKIVIGTSTNKDAKSAVNEAPEGLLILHFCYLHVLLRISRKLLNA